jgi:hypothetical protein
MSMANKTARMHGRINVYTCQTCGKATVTFDRDEGVTPFYLSCRRPGCPGPAQSACYRVDQSLVPDFEWYKPPVVEEIPAGFRDHVRKGGLLLRDIATGERIT